MFAQKLFSSVAFAAFLTSISPVVALADEGPRGDRSAERAKGEEKGARAHFPMPAEKFNKIVAARLAKVRGRIEKHLDKRGVSAEQRAEAIKRLDAAEAKIRAAADAATKDGTVTKEEAKEVRGVVKELKRNANAHRHGKAKGKGKGKGKGSSDTDA